MAAAFAPGGPLASRLSGFEPRPSQRAMAAAVADALTHEEALLAQAGTGTGKTLAYLVPAILSRRRVLISTGTKNLQEQIFFKDIPLLRDALGVPFTATYMKGRGNFLCLHRFEAARGRLVPRSPADRFQLEAIARWLPGTDTGDRAEIEDLAEDSPIWSDVSASAENCIGAECPRYQDCFVTKMRQRAAESDLVIVNHHLLCADAAVRQSAYGEVIPECHYAVIDEAHQLEDVATQYFGVSVSTYRLQELVRDGERALGAAAVSDRSAARDVSDALARVAARSTDYFDALAAARRDAAPRANPAEAGSHARPERAAGRTGDERVRVDASWLEQVADESALLQVALDGLAAAIALLKEAPEDLRSIGRRATDLRGEIEFLQRATDDTHVYYLESRGRGVFLKASPIDVSDIIQELLLDRMRATVLTSATLTVDGGFDYVRGRLGVQEAAELNVPSEFDYGTQTVLYLPRRMPDPRSAAFTAAAAEEMAEILRRTQGRAFGLFTSYANLREVHARLERALDYPMFVQGTAPRSALLRDFRATPHAVLLATSSFWQGVDVIGDALSCVIIDKLPFASPGDPITAARIEAIRRRGGDPFNSYQVPLAILTLLQGLGRLIRHRADRGVLAILDPRIRTMGYGRRFLHSMPRAPIVLDVTAISAFFEAAAAAGGPEDGSGSAVSW